MKTFIAFAVFVGMVLSGALYASGHWIAGALVICACGYAVTTQDPDYDTRNSRRADYDVD